MLPVFINLLRRLYFMHAAAWQLEKSAGMFFDK